MNIFEELFPIMDRQNTQPLLSEEEYASLLQMPGNEGILDNLNDLPDSFLFDDKKMSQEQMQFLQQQQQQLATSVGSAASDIPMLVS